MEKIRYGVIGVKGIGRYHADLARGDKRVKLAALVDIDADYVRNLSDELGVRAFTDYRDMLDAGIVDAVSIATPHHLHEEIGLDCLKAGVHTFLEKPLAVRVSQADEIVTTARDKNLNICVCHQYRTHRSSRMMKNIIDSGTIGNIRRVLWSWVDFRPESYYSRDIWRATWSHSGGGVLMNQVSHDLDLICWMVGKPSQVIAVIGNQLHSAEIEDIACASMIFSNGAFGSFQVTINQPKGYSIRQIGGDKGILVIQDVKSLTNDQDDNILLGIYDENLQSSVKTLNGYHDQPQVRWQLLKPRRMNGRVLWKRTARKFDRVVLKRIPGLKHVSDHLDFLKLSRPIGHPALMTSFIDAIADGGEPLINGESAHSTVEVINALILSAIRKKTVDLSIDREEYDELFEELRTGRTVVPRYHC